ncbi:alpha/beta hydrolase fold domain-containing protein [Streptomyces sp. NPDC091377]|uniref:alpha/beta hydrolase fold domain-containing protein n=1 Tax=Streptomyces sp. NPDC091377 TaxID=3365995 RepID=UPI0037F29F6D
MTGSFRKILMAAALCGLAVVAGAPGGAVAAPGTEPATPAQADCPAPPPLGGLAFATSVAPGDNRTSVVLQPKASDPKNQCGVEEVTLREDITYATVPGAGGQQRELKLDLQTPATGGPRPLVVFITGGGFISADKSGFIGRRTHLAEQGYAVASIEYRTILDEATYVEGVADAKAAIRFLRAHAAEFGIDTREVAVYGESAGGYLASMAGTTGGVKKFDTGAHLDQSSRVQAVVNWFGPSDLAKIPADFDPATRASQENSTDDARVKYVLGPNNPTRLLDVPAAVAAADPATYASPGDAPFVHFHGSNDRIISPSQTLLLHEALRAKGVPSTRYVVKGAGHGHLVPEGDTSAPMWNTRQVMRPVTTFLRCHLS